MDIVQSYHSYRAEILVKCSCVTVFLSCLLPDAGQKALADARVPYSAIEQACVGYVYGDSTCGQRAIYHSLGLTGIPIINVNNNCSTGSTALFMARQLIQGGLAECVLALGFEKMERGSLSSKYMDRTNPMDKHMEVMINRYGMSAAPAAPQMFGNGEKRACTVKYSQFQEEYSLQQVMKSRKVFEFLTLLQCCPTSDGAGAAVLASEAFVRRHGLEGQAVEILAQEMVTDLSTTFEENSCMKMVGYDMSRLAAKKCFEASGLKPRNVDVVELHDCFSANELITYEALGLCPEGQAGELIDRGDNTYGGKFVVNPSGGLISKGHPLGATGLAQCAELCWQLRGQADRRQVPGAKVALQHNIGLGGAVVVTLYRMGFPEEARSLVGAIPTSSVSSLEGFKAYPVFQEINRKLQEDHLMTLTSPGDSLQDGEEYVKKIGAVFAFNVKNGPDGKEGLLVVDVKNGKGCISTDPDLTTDCTVAIDDEDLLALMTGKLNPQTAFYQGKLKLSGNLSMALKLQNLQMSAGKAKL
uniref:Sterol carrier protein 2 n=1 Tax=Myripristis murdjan TaxID=586833 RepID=A0A667YQT7_9TELE